MWDTWTTASCSPYRTLQPYRTFIARPDYWLCSIFELWSKSLYVILWFQWVIFPFLAFSDSFTHPQINVLSIFISDQKDLKKGLNSSMWHFKTLILFTCCVLKNTILSIEEKHTVIYYIAKFFRDKSVDQYFLKYNNTLYHVILLRLYKK